MHYKKGSEWRKWDLHVHTPSSIYQCYGGGDNDATWEAYISCLENLPKEFAVLGINDYFFIDGYERLIKEQNENKRIQNLILFPVVEFRIDKFAGVSFGSLKRINLHVIFSNELSIETIKSQFLNTLEQSYILESGVQWSRAITRESVADLGTEIKRNVSPEHISKYGSDLFEGFNNLNVKEEQIFKSLEKDCFKNKYLIAIGKTEWDELKWSDSSIATKKTIINKADIVFTASENIDKYNKAKSKLKEQGVNNFLLDCSDAHNFSDSANKDRIGNCFTWLKADPTFDGLLQVLNEPEERVFIGEKPHIIEKVENNRTKYIKELSINYIADYNKSHGIWFENIKISFNKELVVIIGNKGSGKSAIADVISLCSNFHDDNDFSFLTNKKFREKQGRIAKNFEASLLWEDENKYSKMLSDNAEDSELIRVKYIPQGQFERLTNEINSVEGFQTEIEKVVFAHIPETERLDTKSFRELIDKETNSVTNSIKTLGSNIEEINKQIIELETQATPSYKKEMENHKIRKQAELDALIKPIPITNPNEDPVKKESNKAVNDVINLLNSEINALELEMKQKNDEKKSLVNSLQQLKEIKDVIAQKETEFRKFVQDKEMILKEYSIDATQLLPTKIDFSQIDTIISNKNSELIKVKVALGEINDVSNTSSLLIRLEEKQNNLDKEKAKLDIEQQQYQEYLSKVEIWKKNIDQIIGASDTVDTLEYYKQLITYLETQLETDLEKKYKERRLLVEKIFDEKQKIVLKYKSIRDSLNSILNQNSDILKDYNILIDASLVKKADFNSKFLDFINKNIAGTYFSNIGGEKYLKQITEEINFDCKEDITKLLDELTYSLRFDMREVGNNEPREVSKQVRDIPGLYNYLFTLQFLENIYQLKQGGKELQQLSPGERGALLLVFYLLLDNNNIPLIIDQPEDNLDNHSVATVLVPFIRAAKKKRQIIMVTHNPNLAVVADAEQIIYVNLDKNNNYKFSTLTGSIENKDINTKIVEVLEGAMPAFNNRKNKYYD